MKRYFTLACVTLVFAQPAQADDSARDWAATCANCHGTNGAGIAPMPSLAGLERDYIVQQMADFRSGKRPATIMQQIAKGLSEDLTGAIAGYFAQQPRPR